MPPVPVYGVSELGRQVCSLGTRPASELYLRAIASWLTGMGFTVLTCDIAVSKDRKIELLNPQIFQPAS